MSLLLADDGTVEFYQSINVPVTVTVDIQKRIALFLDTTVTVAVNMQRLIGLNINVNVPVIVNATERLFLKITIAVTSAIVVALDATALFFQSSARHVRRFKWKWRRR